MSDDPFDHNGECRFCDEQGMHRADCPWLLELQRENAQMRNLLAAAQRRRERLESIVSKLKDRLAVARANDDTAWEPPETVPPTKKD